jgi:predicted ATP-grasp superfamily ATP-dependent carboligase
MKPVIVLDCHLRSQEGILSSLSREGLFVIGLSHDSTCPAFKSKFINKKIISPNLDEDNYAYIIFLLKLKIKGVIIYSNDLSAMVCSEHKSELVKAGFDIVISDSKILKTAFDKWDCYNFANHNGVKSARSIFINAPSELFPAWEQLNKPIILKPTRLAGGNYIKVVDKSMLEEAWNKVNRYNLLSPGHHSRIIMQEWLTYEITDIWSCETVYDRQHQNQGFYSIKRIRSSLDRVTSVYTSRLFAGEYQQNKRLETITKKLLDNLSWQGFAHVEFMYVPEDDEYYLAEINPRLPGYSYFPSNSGYNMGYLYYKAAISEPTTYPEKFGPAIYFESFRYPGDISEGIYQTLKGNLSFTVFIKSYIKLIGFKGTVIIDPIRTKDMNFTLMSIKRDLISVVINISSWWKNKFKK